MNDYQNDKDNMNNGYNQGYGQDFGGGYSYNYTPNGDNFKRHKNQKVKKFFILLLTFALLASAVITSAVAIGSMVINNVGTSDSDSNADLSTGSSSNGSQGDTSNIKNVVIYKQQPQTDNTNLTSAGQAYNSFTQVYDAVSETVVEITTETVKSEGFIGQYVSTGAGSGVIVGDGEDNNSYYIVTNNHVIEGASNITVTLKNGTDYTATLVGTDEASDIAVIIVETNGAKLSVARLGNSSDVKVGEDVVAIGNPLGSLGGTLTNGIISATERQISIDGQNMTLLQTTAAINPGNSGGGLFNMAGCLIGVVNAKASGEDIEGIGFAIPVDTAYSVVKDLIEYGYVRGVPDCGITTVEVTSANLYSLYYKYGITSAGVMVKESKYTDELKLGDLIVSINGTEISSESEIENIIRTYSVGDEIIVVAKRNGSLVSAKITLREKVPDSVNFE